MHLKTDDADDGGVSGVTAGVESGMQGAESSGGDCDFEDGVKWGVF